VRSKIEIDGSILEKVKQFKYSGWELSLDGEWGFDKKISFSYTASLFSSNLFRVVITFFNWINV
jgi:hypothetical protein